MKSSGALVFLSVVSVFSVVILINRFRDAQRVDKSRKTVRKLQAVENPGGGDCLFWCFKQALETIGQEISVAALRRVVSNSVDNDTFVFLRTLYQNAVEDNNLDMLKEFAYVKNLTTLSELKEAMLCPTYWGDELAVVALENFTGLQAFILKNEQFQQRPGVNQRKKAIYLDLRNEHYRLFRTEDGQAIFDNPSSQTRVC